MGLGLGLGRVEGAVAELRTNPGQFADAGDLARVLSVGRRELDRLVRTAYHTSVTALFERARVEAAQRAVAEGARWRDAAEHVGFTSSAAGEAVFRRWTGLLPQEWARLGERADFVLRLPRGFRSGPIFRVQARDADSISERSAGGTLIKALNLGGRPVRLAIRVTRDRAHCEIQGRPRAGRRVARAAHTAALRLLGMTQDPTPFERQVSRRRRLGRLVDGRSGTRIPQTADPFEGLIWCLVGQQVNLAFAYRLRRVLVGRVGTPAGDGLVAHPTARQVASLDVADLTRAQFSRRKAEYVVETARAIDAGRLPLDALSQRPAPIVEQTLLDVRGIGPWSANYLMMRGLGFADCVPAGDSGLSAALQRFFSLAERPDAAAQRELMEAFAPYRSLATFHLWLSLGDAP